MLKPMMIALYEETGRSPEHLRECGTLKPMMIALYEETQRRKDRDIERAG